MPKDEQKQFRENIKSILLSIGEDVDREGLIGTPKRVYKAYKEMFGGYSKDPKKILQKALFKSDNENMVVVSDIDFFSTCEHHMLPIIGKAFVAYIPDKKVVGLSKIPRLVDIYAKRLQIQENMTEQIANAMMENISPKGVGVLIQARHLCIEMRGAKKVNSLTSTFSYKGIFKDKDIKQEFLIKINNNVF